MHEAGHERPVAALFVLRQAPTERLVRATPAEAFQALAPHVTPLRAPWCPGNTLEPLAALVESVPAWHLHHTLSTDPLAVLGAALA